MGGHTFGLAFFRITAADRLGRMISKLMEQSVSGVICTSVRERGGRVIWTSEKPTKPGWYWYRSQHDRVQIIELIEWNKELRTIGVSPGMYPHQETHRVPDGPGAEWAGPMERP